MMPVDAPLPCRDHPEPFDAYLSDDVGRTRARLRALASCRALCATCDYRSACLREFGTESGVIAGLTADERKAMRVA